LNAYYWLFQILAIPISCYLFYYLVYKYYKFNINNKELASIILNIIILGWLGSFLSGILDIAIHEKSYNLVFLFNIYKNTSIEHWYGALFLNIIYFIYLRYKYKSSLINIISYVACLSLIIGKFGCYFSQHYGCYGIETNLPWGKIYNNGIVNSITPRHPIQLYDILFHTVIFSYFSYFIFYKKTTFNVFYSFIISTSLYNIIIEIIKTTNKEIIGLSLGQLFYCFFIFIVLIDIFIVKKLYYSKQYYSNKVG
jgi:prolipoprotein diacylglyceryltransferase